MHAVTRLGLALALALAGLGPACPDAAGIVLPWPPYCTLPARVTLVGLCADGPDAALGEFVVLVRDNRNQGLANSAVFCELPEDSDFRFAASQPDPLVIVQCGDRGLYKFTDAAGAVRITLLGGGRSPLGPPAAADRMTVYADGVPLGSVPVTCYDLDGRQGVDGADLSCWAHDFHAGTHPDRSDFDGDGRVTLADLSRWAAVYFAGTSAQSPPEYCP